MPVVDGVLTELGTVNNGWGVCGFTSSFYALYDCNHTTHGQIINATAAYRVLAEIKTYLMMLKAENNSLLKDITKFTQSFGGIYASFTIEKYIDHINKAAWTNKSEEDILKDKLYGIAMPPLGVVEYLKRKWDKDTTIQNNYIPGKKGIVGLHKGEGGLYKGLKHYVYSNGGTIYSWGKSFDSIEKAWGNKGGPCYFIAL